MAKKYKLPISEASGRRPLSGTYKVSFEITAGLADELRITDIVQTLAEGFLSQSVDNKIGKVNVEKIEIESSLQLKIGERVILAENVDVNASIFEDDGIYIVGDETKNVRILGQKQITLPQSGIGIVNKVLQGEVELIEFDQTVKVTLQDEETDEIVETNVNVDRVIVPTSSLKRIEDDINNS